VLRSLLEAWDKRDADSVDPNSVDPVVAK
jgi:hypothetical protein